MGPQPPPPGTGLALGGAGASPGSGTVAQGRPLPSARTPVDEVAHGAASRFIPASLPHITCSALTVSHRSAPGSNFLPHRGRCSHQAWKMGDVGFDPGCSPSLSPYLLLRIDIPGHSTASNLSCPRANQIIDREGHLTGYLNAGLLSLWDLLLDLLLPQLGRLWFEGSQGAPIHAVGHVWVRREACSNVGRHL